MNKAEKIRRKKESRSVQTTLIQLKIGLCGIGDNSHK